MDFSNCAVLVVDDRNVSNIMDAAQAGADGYILKAFSESTLSQKTGAILQCRVLA